METVFREIKVGSATFTCAMHNKQNYIAASNIYNALGVSNHVVLNVLRRQEPYKSLCVQIDKRDAKGRTQSQFCLPLSTITGLIEVLRSKNPSENDKIWNEKIDSIFAFVTIIEQKLANEHLEMSEDLIAIMRAEAEEKEVFATRAELSNRVREAKKLKRGYYDKYMSKINGQLVLGE
jgi:hypothetical protein